ncbi:hypothetical protein [Halomarina rubra]|uniref:Major facilitator superfamily (MFS) profile domain-containing protein n=1 Tax=Halomarina rubra TaxID=2071873 RepID=A0ABD6B0M7_9EURY|nr:hypothetical protein [Halomarina rubra]
MVVAADVIADVGRRETLNMVVYCLLAVGVGVVSLVGATFASIVRD